MIKQILHIASMVFMICGIGFAAYWRGQNKGFQKASKMYQAYIDKMKALWGE